MLNFNVIQNFPSVTVFNLRNNLLNDFFYFNDFRNFNDFFNYFLLVNWNLDNFFFYSLDWNRDFPHNLYFYEFLLEMIDHSIDLDNFFNFNDFLDLSVHILYFWYFLHNFDDFLNNYRHFNNFLNDIFNRDYFFNLINIHFWNFKLHIYNLFYFLYHLLFNNLFNDFFNYFNFGNLHNFLYNLFYYFLNFDNLRNASEYLQDIINFNNSHDFLSDHSDHSFINVQDTICSNFYFLQFLKQSFNQNSQMELNFP